MEIFPHVDWSRRFFKRAYLTGWFSVPRFYSLRWGGYVTSNLFIIKLVLLDDFGYDIRLEYCLLNSPTFPLLFAILRIGVPPLPGIVRVFVVSSAIAASLSLECKFRRFATPGCHHSIVSSVTLY